MRRYAPLQPSRGTVIPTSVRNNVLARDAGCVGARIGMPGECSGRLELDHVRAGGMGLKSPSEDWNLVALCSQHHRHRTENGREWRPLLLAYIADPFNRRYGLDRETTA